ncbi:MAG: hypothetical protein LBG67_05515 [Campylobacteraceae bacterium]|jgi:uncharacterized lipoprotein YehR (DUF1307 family)|nr:hypothetical protein [Campylobacteraceae bacterium]
MKKVLTILVLGLAVLSFSGCGDSDCNKHCKSNKHCYEQCKAAKKTFSSFPKEFQELNKVEYDQEYFDKNDDIVEKYSDLCTKYQFEIDITYHQALYQNCARIGWATRSINYKNGHSGYPKWE